VTCHDGFTLEDLVSYTAKDNVKNGEGNRDGLDENHSFGHGADGPADDPTVVTRRARTKRALLATLAISRGVPMLLHGDELGRTQEGNNNAYCQASELAWMDWSMAETNAEFLQFVRDVFAFRRENPLLRRLRFAKAAGDPNDTSQMIWLSATGNEMTEWEWAVPSRRFLAAYLGDGPADAAVSSPAYLFLCNASDDRMHATMPRARFGSTWAVVLDTDVPTVVDLWRPIGGALPGHRLVSAGEAHRIGPKTLQVLRRVAR
jgi:glycogen operon protein